MYPIDYKCISALKLVNFFKEKCEQFDDIYIDIDGKRQKLSACTEPHPIFITDVFDIEFKGEKKLLIMSSMFIGEHVTEVTSSQGLMVHEFLSIILEAIDPDNISIGDIIINHNDGTFEKYTSAQQIWRLGIKNPNRQIKKIDIEFIDDDAEQPSPNIIITTK